VNIDRAAEDVASAVNAAGVSANEDNANLAFHTRSSIKAEYEPRIGEPQQNLQKMLALPVLEIMSNLEHKFAKLVDYKPEKYDFPQRWHKTV